MNQTLVELERMCGELNNEIFEQLGATGDHDIPQISFGGTEATVCLTLEAIGLWDDQTCDAEALTLPELRRKLAVYGETLVKVFGPSAERP